MEQQNNGSIVKQRIHRRVEILNHLADQEESEFSTKEYCEMFDIHEQTFNSWLRKYRNKSDEEVKGFTTIEIVPPATSSKPELFAEVNGIRLYKEVSADYLKTLVS